MSNKKKGSNAERELVHMFWECGFAPVRVAGSGSTQIPSADLIVGKSGKTLIIECKSSKNDKIYIDKDRVEEFKEFGSRFGGEMWIAVRFNRKEWRFLTLSQIRDSGKNIVIDDEFAHLEGITFSILKEKF